MIFKDNLEVCQILDYVFKNHFFKFNILKEVTFESFKQTIKGGYDNACMCHINIVDIGGIIILLLLVGQRKMKKIDTII